MKIFIFGTAFILCSFVWGISKTNHQKLTLSAERDHIDSDDTTFLKRNVTADCYHAIYVETNRKSHYYKWLTNFVFDDDDSLGYLSNYDYFKKRNANSYTQRGKTGLNRDWIPVYQYNDVFYLYAPSDWGNAGKRIINDSAFVYWYMDGPMPMSIKSVSKTGSGNHQIELDDLHEISGSSVLTIYEVDSKTHLSIFEYQFGSDEPRYQLYIPKESASQFDIIVNHCENRKQLEYDFEDIDFDQLIKNRK